MKRALISVMLIIIIVFIIIGCGKGSVVEHSGFTEPNFTVEEFLAYIETHETSLKESDLVDVDDSIIEGFINYYSLSIERTWVLRDLKATFDDYIEKVINNDHHILLSVYRVRELMNVDSTKEEYLDFIQKFFNAIEVEATFQKVQNDGVRTYEYSPSHGTLILFNFCQSNNTEI